MGIVLLLRINIMEAEAESKAKVAVTVTVAVSHARAALTTDQHYADHQMDLTEMGEIDSKNFLDSLFIPALKVAIGYGLLEWTRVLKTYYLPSQIIINIRWTDPCRVHKRYTVEDWFKWNFVCRSCHQDIKAGEFKDHYKCVYLACANGTFQNDCPFHKK